MTRKTGKGFLSVCGRHNPGREFHPQVAVLPALTPVGAADRITVPDQEAGKALTGHYLVAGAKAVPSLQE